MHDINCLAVVRLSGCLLERILSYGEISCDATHGVRNITIVDAEYDPSRNVFVLLVFSEDIPAYVAYNKVNNLLHVTSFKEVNYPELFVVFESELSKPDKGISDV